MGRGYKQIFGTAEQLKQQQEICRLACAWVEQHAAPCAEGGERHVVVPGSRNGKLYQPGTMEITVMYHGRGWAFAEARFAFSVWERGDAQLVAEKTALAARQAYRQHRSQEVV